MPEQDETYAEDSFVLHGSDVEEASDEEPVDVILEDSYIDGRKQYATRRRAQIKQIRAAHETSGVQSETGRRNKRSRIIPVQDSSEEEEETEFKVPQCASTVPEKKVRQTDGQQETFSHLMDEQVIITADRQSLYFVLVEIIYRFSDSRHVMIKSTLMRLCACVLVSCLSLF